ncbi:hypothetical protein [Tolypothrix sp. VBCCA 56010]
MGNGAWGIGHWAWGSGEKYFFFLALYPLPFSLSPSFLPNAQFPIPYI